MRIIIIEDERDLNNLIAERLEEEGYDTVSCFDGKTAYEKIVAEEFDAAILDLMIPRLDGRKLLMQIRSENILIPVLILSALDNNESVVEGLDLGADDYLTKPFDFDILMARIRAILRKRGASFESIYRCGDLELHTHDRSVIRDGKSIALTPKEYSILEYMLRNQNVVLTREQLENDVWDLKSSMSSNVVDVYIRYLRKKIDDDFDSKLIHTIRGVGYRLSYDND